jgi:hypothetical protein
VVVAVPVTSQFVVLLDNGRSLGSVVLLDEALGETVVLDDVLGEAALEGVLGEIVLLPD